jgi:hypothetical protein
MAQEVANVHIHIDQRAYVSANPTTGAALYQLAHIPAGAELVKDGHARDSRS